MTIALTPLHEIVDYGMKTIAMPLYEMADYGTKTIECHCMLMVDRGMKLLRNDGFWNENRCMK